MATIVTRKGESGPSFQARLRLTRNGELIHKESKTFSTKAAAKLWAQAREVELQDPKALTIAISGGTRTLAALIRWYIETFETISPWQRSKQSALEFLERHPIGQLDPLTVTADLLINHIRNRRLNGAGPSTAANDLVWIRIVLDAAKVGQQLPIPLDVVDEAHEYCLKHRLIARSNRRQRRPTNEELERLDGYFQIRDRHKCTVVPMRRVMWFGITSTRREAEICRLEHADNEPSGQTGLVRDAKHPREKLGNHLRFKYTPEGWGIVQAVQLPGRYIFPYNPNTVSDAFTTACRILGIEDLHFHDLRHEAISRLFELGYDIHEVALFSLHSSWDDLKRYTQLRPENLRQVIRKPSGEVEVISPPIRITTYPCPPAAELIPPNTRASRARIFRQLEAMEQRVQVTQ
ncbi:tyrosine-type recombinase/integrase [Steroidobacter agaridevorans]|uniref:tyrosine-type recombinase/integrase n=1 Tax=Steroidobacter agaridevorans TaxID=2695856 RepID=UPI0013238F68|nr:tyrosine-type recombinase/integrase [Steroidobacter agaridevorans]GFE87812.1 integrase [Steroidobacter agaridevorans]